MTDDNTVSFPEEWKAKPLKLAESTKPEVTPAYLAEQAEIARLSEMAEAIPGRADPSNGPIGFPYSKGA